jgi:hypothetical protein
VVIFIFICCFWIGPTVADFCLAELKAVEQRLEPAPAYGRLRFLVGRARHVPSHKLKVRDRSSLGRDPYGFP